MMLCSGAQSPRPGQALSSVVHQGRPQQCDIQGSPTSLSVSWGLSAAGDKAGPHHVHGAESLRGTQRRKQPGWVTEGPRGGGQQVSLWEGHSWSFWNIRGLWEERKKVKGSMKSLCALIRISSVFSQKQRTEAGVSSTD